MSIPARTGVAEVRLIIGRGRDRMLEIERLDRTVALARKAFVSIVPLVLVTAALVPERVRGSIVRTLTALMQRRWTLWTTPIGSDCSR